MNTTNPAIGGTVWVTSGRAWCHFFSANCPICVPSLQIAARIIRHSANSPNSDNLIMWCLQFDTCTDARMSKRGSAKLREACALSLSVRHCEQGGVMVTWLLAWSQGRETNGICGKRVWPHGHNGHRKIKKRRGKGLINPVRPGAGSLPQSSTLAHWPLLQLVDLLIY